MEKSPGILGRIQRDPVGFMKRAFFKTLIGPFRYKRGEDYDAPRYWQDRFKKYGVSLLGPGDEGLTEKDNAEMYAEARRRFLQLLKREGIDFAGKRVLEIGVGNGFWTEVAHAQGAASYTGVDITDVLFADHRKRFPNATFIKADAAEERLSGEYDLILMIDVIQHIVTPDRLTRVMDNVRACLDPQGAFVLSPITDRSKRLLYYVAAWNMDDIASRFPGFTFSDPAPFRGDSIVLIRPAGTGVVKEA